MYEREKERYKQAVPAFIVLDLDGTDVTDTILSEPKRKRISSVVTENKARKLLPEIASLDAAGELVPWSDVGDAEL